MLINRLYHPFFHDASWMWAMDVSPLNSYSLLFGCKGTKFGTNSQIFSLFFLNPKIIRAREKYKKMVKSQNVLRGKMGKSQFFTPYFS